MTRLRWRIVGAATLATLAALIVFASTAPATPESGPGSATLWRLIVSLGVAIVVALPLTSLVLAPLVRSAERIGDRARAIARGGQPEQASASEVEELAPIALGLGETIATVRQQLAALEAEHTRLTAVLAHMGDGVIMANRDGQVVVINAAAAELLGTTPEQARGRSLVDIARDYELVEAARGALSGTPTETPVLLTMGMPRREVQVVATAVPAQPGEQSRVLLVLQDVTELRRAERIRREFVANVSHELRTPVASLKALAETLDNGALEDPPAARAFLASMLVETDRLAQLVTELLELALLESGAAPLARAPVDIADLVPRAVERLQTTAEAHGVRLIVEPGAGTVTVLGDAPRLERVIINLVHNAIKYTPPGGEVRIHYALSGDHVALTVHDTGSGIPPEELPRVFERFFKVDRARASAGTGLGLAIVRHTVEAHGGRVWAESTVGVGSTFTVTIPVASIVPSLPGANGSHD